MTPLLVAVLALSPCRLTPRETVEACLVRKASIAEDLSEVTRDYQKQVLLAVVATHESGMRLDIDEDVTRGDGGRACGLFQLQGVDCSGLTRAEQGRIALRRIGKSFEACSKNDKRAALEMYASGSCGRGRKDSAAMIDMWRRALWASSSSFSS